MEEEKRTYTSECFQKTSQEERKLTEQEEKMLEKQNSKIVSEFRQQKLESEALKMWDLFYKRNATNFFKDRHWTAREFNEFAEISQKKESFTMLEAGCGVGNAFFPILETIPNIFVYACDFSPRAIDLIKKSESYDEKRCKAFPCDLTTNQVYMHIPQRSIDIITLFFVLSAVHPDNFKTLLQNLFELLKPGGILLFRDYGVNDWAMLRFSAGSKLCDNFYVRQDGTRAYYFKLNEMEKLMADCGYQILSNEYVLRETINKKEDVHVPRVFLQGKYLKS